jgi:hypothetical protein
MKNSIVWLVVICLAGCVSVQPKGLYEMAGDPEPLNVYGFSQLEIFKDDITSEVWFTENQTCLNVKQERDQKFDGSGAIRIKWDKQAGGCPWLGLGIGWSGWAGKDFSQIYDKAALSFRVKTDQKPMNGLPWAIGFEDYGGSQKWTGGTPDIVVNGPISDKWTQVKIPLTKFDMQYGDFDIYAIKQLLFQFESNGEVFVDHIEIVSL